MLDHTEAGSPGPKGPYTHKAGARHTGGRGRGVLPGRAPLPAWILATETAAQGRLGAAARTLACLWRAWGRKVVSALSMTGIGHCVAGRRLDGVGVACHLMALVGKHFFSDTKEGQVALSPHHLPVAMSKRGPPGELVGTNCTGALKDPGSGYQLP